MKINNVNHKKIICILASSIILLTGCQNETINNDESFKEIETIVSDVTTTEIEYNDIDMKVINKFNELESDLEKLLNNEKIEDVKTKSKEMFITIVDFIFYGSEINGVTFEELSDKGKEKVLNIASSIDSKIEIKFPNYKENISNKTDDILNKASNLINKGVNNLKDFSKEKLGNDYGKIIEEKNEVVNSTKESLETVTNLSKEAYSKGKKYIKNWYEELKK